MVFDSIKNASKYYGLSKGIEMALKYFEELTEEKYETGKIIVDGDNVFVHQFTYTTAPDPVDCSLEAHRDYIDVMYVVKGDEKYYCKPLDRCEKVVKEYEPDCMNLSLDDDVLVGRFPEAHFAIFFPQDAHCAARMWDKPSDVLKCCAKVSVNMK